MPNGFRDPGAALTRRNRLAQMLMAQEQAAPPIQAHTQGLASMFRQGLAGYMQGQDIREREAAQEMLRRQADSLINALVGGIRGAEQEFDLDYWGLSYRGALEHVLKHDDREEIRVYVSEEIGEDSAGILEPEDRKRLIYVDKSAKANYHLSTFRWQERSAASPDPFHTIEIDGVSIIDVYRVRF